MSVTERIDDRLPVSPLEAVGSGVGAYLVGVVVTYVLEGSGSSEGFGPISASDGAGSTFTTLQTPTDFELTGMLYHAAHVGVDVGITLGGLGRSPTLSTGGVAIEAQSLVVLPPLVLAGAGYVLARRNADAAEPPVRVGASVAVGYALAAIVGAFFLFRWESSSAFSDATVSVGPGIAESLLLCSGYGVAFGAAGGYVWDLRGESDDTVRREAERGAGVPSGSDEPAEAASPASDEGAEDG